MLTANIYRQMLDPSNKVDNLEHLYTTMCLMALEMGEEEVLVELFRLTLHTQRMCCGATPLPAGLDTAPVSLPLTHRCAIHALLVAFVSVLSQLGSVGEVAEKSGLADHVAAVIAAREKGTPYLLPKVAFNRHNTSER